MAALGGLAVVPALAKQAAQPIWDAWTAGRRNRRVAQNRGSLSCGNAQADTGGPP